ncbi:hypothetical protein [Capnocytophaga canimorsus]|uniref:hypothetical protein n=1 Tax=Capnocytophaga canimorsus TaxID=28188 RepID=UPI001ACDD9DB|nr:hypothetical protein [Capnocytophaga canimorsus]GIM59024.1 hypothetical protein CAPN007_12320 [Capnocytophaga canimorsus]
MKVYAHFFIEKGEKEVQYRWRTLLQFGDSWEVIGSVVMKNPGSAKSKLIVSDEKILEQLNKFDASEKWHEFTADNTMQNIEKLFREYSKFNNSDFKGVIQVFNLFNVVEADLGEALKIAQNVKNRLFYQTTDVDLNNLKAPVYLGWGGLGNDEQFKPAALKFFEKVKSLNISYLHNEFEVNNFYHPQYLMMYGTNEEYVYNFKQTFFQNTTTPTYISKFSIKKKLEEALKLEKYENGKITNRYIFVGGLQLTITAEGDGYVAIRHQNFVGDYARKEYANESQFAEILKNKDYGRPYPKYWLGQKNFKEYGKTEDQIVESIISEIESLKTDFDKVK